MIKEAHRPTGIRLIVPALATVGHWVEVGTSQGPKKMGLDRANDPDLYLKGQKAQVGRETALKGKGVSSTGGYAAQGTGVSNSGTLGGSGGTTTGSKGTTIGSEGTTHNRHWHRH